MPDGPAVHPYLLAEPVGSSRRQIRTTPRSAPISHRGMPDSIRVINVGEVSHPDFNHHAAKGRGIKPLSHRSDPNEGSRFRAPFLKNTSQRFRVFRGNSKSGKSSGEAPRARLILPVSVQLRFAPVPLRNELRLSRLRNDDEFQ